MHTTTIATKLKTSHIKTCATLLILALGLSSCQSTQDLKEKEKTAQLLETKLKIAQTKLDQGRAIEAQYELEPLIRRYPNNPAILNLMGLSDIALKNHDRAISSLKKAFELERSAQNALNLSSAYIASKNYELALKTIDQGIEIGQKTNYKKLMRLYHNKAFTFERKNQPKKAEEYYKKALYHSPGFILTLQNLGAIYESQGRHDEAKNNYLRFTYACNACYLPVKKLVGYHIKGREFADATRLLKTFMDNANTRSVDRQNAKRQLLRINRLSQQQRRTTKPRSYANSQKSSLNSSSGKSQSNDTMQKLRIQQPINKTQ